MKLIFKPGDKKVHQHCVEPSDWAQFESGTVHEVYSTFALGRDAEWTCRLFVLDMLEDGEEGIGTFLSVEHVSPALDGSDVRFEAIVESIKGNEIICTYVAKVDERVIATGRQGQKIIKKEKLSRLFASLK